MCSEKISYISDAEAVAQAQVRLTLDASLRLYLYCCPECGFYHLTKARKLPVICGKLIEVKRSTVRPQPQFTIEDLRRKWGAR
jgi:hypothetical protein